ncbi:MAG: fluoride efflux transporter CrcB [Prevotellaceae bacterium]|jgi:CrcB protein|nr:fluoride efflux transporter CrcB [Prevotellaceae bacterium]
MWRTLFLVFLGGGAGSTLRYLTSVLTARWTQPAVTFPIATFTVNIAGCLLAGLLIGLIDKGTLANPGWRFLLITGFCGGYTTFSAFSAENLLLLQRGDYGLAVIYITTSILLGLAAVWLGFLLGK